jgi:hypothetical protein
VLPICRRGLVLVTATCCLGVHSVGAVVEALSTAPYSEFEPSEQQNQTVGRLLRVDDEDAAVAELFRRGIAVVPELTRSLRALELRARAARALAYIADPGGLKALLEAIRTERDPALKMELSAYLAGSLVATRDREYLTFLKRCIERYRDDEADMPAAAAALALGSMKTADALAILQLARSLDEEDLAEHEIAKARRWIESGRPVVGYRTSDHATGDDGRIEQLVLRNAFYAEGEERGLDVEEVTWNSGRDRALVGVTIREDSGSLREYHVIVERVRDRASTFRIVGVWLNMIS